MNMLKRFQVPIQNKILVNNHYSQQKHSKSEGSSFMLIDCKIVFAGTLMTIKIETHPAQADV